MISDRMRSSPREHPPVSGGRPVRTASPAMGSRESHSAPRVFPGCTLQAGPTPRCPIQLHRPLIPGRNPLDRERLLEPVAPLGFPPPPDLLDLARLLPAVLLQLQRHGLVAGRVLVGREGMQPGRSALRVGHAGGEPVHRVRGGEGSGEGARGVQGKVGCARAGEGVQSRGSRLRQCGGGPTDEREGGRGEQVRGEGGEEGGGAGDGEGLRRAAGQGEGGGGEGGGGGRRGRGGGAFEHARVAEPLVGIAAGRVRAQGRGRRGRRHRGGGGQRGRRRGGEPRHGGRRGVVRLCGQRGAGEGRKVVRGVREPRLLRRGPRRGLLHCDGGRHAFCGGGQGRCGCGGRTELL
ncbi:hypothetical protein DFJ74DRAFT_736113, partial [Hyaloraphidium curvatum]